jgi:L-threonylcarbamoyladenylate synthase
MRAEILMPTPDAIRRAAALLRAGELVAFPTETVYGLGGDATNAAAVAAIFAAKGRPALNPLICHVADVAAARPLARFDARAEILATAFWPGPLTLVLPRAADCPATAAVSAGLPSLAVRAPAHPIAQALLAAAGVPLAAPSANRAGRISATAAAHVLAELGDKVKLILDGGDCAIGIESTVVGLTGEQATLLRPGGLATGDIEALIGPLARPGAGPAESPGMLSAHYAPRLPLRINALHPEGREGLLAFGPHAPSGFAAVFNLSERGDLAEAAHNLYAGLRALDRDDLDGIAVAPIPAAGLGVAINDRLRRAAKPPSA